MQHDCALSGELTPRSLFAFLTVEIMSPSLASRRHRRRSPPPGRASRQRVPELPPAASVCAGSHIPYALHRAHTHTHKSTYDVALTPRRRPQPKHTGHHPQPAQRMQCKDLSQSCWLQPLMRFCHRLRYVLAWRPLCGFVNQQLGCGPVIAGSRGASHGQQAERDGAALRADRD